MKHPSGMTPAQRKQKLLAEGALHRANIILARADIAAGMHPSALVKDAVTHFASTAKVLALGAVRDAVSNPAKLSPLLISAFSLLSKRALRKPLLYASIASSAIGGLIYLSKLFNNTANTPANPEDPGAL